MNPRYTPNSKIKNALRRLWLYSRERAFALKLAEYKCQKCGVKQSKAKGKEIKIEVHHKNGIVWESTVNFIRKELLVGQEDLEVLCKACHLEKHMDPDSKI